MGEWGKKPARLIGKKPLDLVGKLRRKTDNFVKVVDEKVIDKKVVDEKPFNLMGTLRGKPTPYGWGCSLKDRSFEK